VPTLTANLHHQFCSPRAGILPALLKRSDTIQVPLTKGFALFERNSVAVRLRLTRVGGKKNPIWRVVVADQRSPRDGRIIEIVGQYNAQTEPSTIRIDEERVREWLAKGAQPSSTVRKLLRTQGIS
jgi:small subunit ribosomal protein S16